MSGRGLKKLAIAIALPLIAALVVAAVLAGAIHTNRRERLHALFRGEEVTSLGTPEEFHEPARYDVDGYTRGGPSEGSPAVDNTSDVDAVTGASRVLRLMAPSAYRERRLPTFLTLTYPTEGAVFPPNLCAPFIEWTDPVNDLWEVSIRLPRDEQTHLFISRARRWRVPEPTWRSIVRTAGEGSVTLRIRGVLSDETRPAVHVSQEVAFRVSPDPADNMIVYRLVDPPFYNRKTPDMFVRDIRELSPQLFLSARQQYCINCHQFSSKSGRSGKLGLQVRYVGQEPFDQRIYLAVADLATGEITKTTMPFKVQMTTFVAFSPDDENRMAFAANQQLRSVAPYVLEGQNTVQASSDIAVCDVEAGVCFLLPGASEPDVLETFPQWTPDGQRLIFATAPAGKHPQQTRFDLNIIDYNNGRGGKPRPLPGASRNGRSNFYPRFSPDGKWFTFVQAHAGSLIKSSSDIFLMPADMSAPPQALLCNAPHAADSWYSWSSNSRWIVFSTKREDGVFARLYLAHIDEEGHASPPVRLPLERPPLMSYNIPEFIRETPSIPERALFEGIRVERGSLGIREVGQATDD